MLWKRAYLSIDVMTSGLQIVYYPKHLARTLLSIMENKKANALISAIEAASIHGLISYYEEAQDDLHQDKAEMQPTTKKTMEASFVINKGSHSYQLHTPTKEFFLSPQKPIIENTDRLICSKYFDLRLSTDTVSKCSDDLEKEYQDHVRKMRVNTYLMKFSSKQTYFHPGRKSQRLGTQSFNISL
ncbi:hypothetical protein BDB01DRAFT_837118 [Pilobolus umbonatus]|nr:hypothetical protein BDB01DRAFT_837118 [Pilobolus umbonatus]